MPRPPSPRSSNLFYFSGPQMEITSLPSQRCRGGSRCRNQRRSMATRWRPNRSISLKIASLAMTLLLSSRYIAGIPHRLPVILWNETKHEVAEGISCNIDGDLHSDFCSLWDLPSYALLDICDQIGIDMEQEILPEVLQVKEKAGNLTKSREPTHDDYVYAAAECIFLEYLEHMETHEFADPDELAKDDKAMAVHLLIVLEDHPHLVHDLEESLKDQDPELWEAVAEELEDGEVLVDRPELLLRLLRQLIQEDSSVLEIGEDDAERQYLQYLERQEL